MLPTKRLLSIDVFRSVTMFFMIFVNDLSSVHHVPAWIDHVKPDEDGMHFADAIFGIFLFIAGLSIPLAIQKRMDRGDSYTSIALYIFLRSLALLVMGFFHVNMENYSGHALLPEGVWELLLTVSFFLIWLDYPAGLSKTKKNALVLSGIFILIFLAIIFKGDSPGEPEGLRPLWWGILGIIGWAYLSCALLYLITKGRLWVLTVFLVVFVWVNIGYHATFVDIDIELWVYKDCASVSLMMAGTIISMLYAQMALKGKNNRLFPVFSLSGVFLILSGFFIRPYTEGLSKINSTPAWVFICSGIGILLFLLFIWLIDVREKQNWFKIIKPAGTSTLTCYLLPYLIFAVFQITDFYYPVFLSNGIGGILRSFGVAFLVIIISGLLEKYNLRLNV